MHCYNEQQQLHLTTFRTALHKFRDKFKFHFSIHHWANSILYHYEGLILQELWYRQQGAAEDSQRSTDTRKAYVVSSIYFKLLTPWLFFVLSHFDLNKLFEYLWVAITYGFGMIGRSTISFCCLWSVKYPCNFPWIEQLSYHFWYLRGNAWPTFNLLIRTWKFQRLGIDQNTAKAFNRHY